MNFRPEICVSIKNTFKTKHFLNFDIKKIKILNFKHA